MATIKLFRVQDVIECCLNQIKQWGYVTKAALTDPKDQWRATWQQTYKQLLGVKSNPVHDIDLVENVFKDIESHMYEKRNNQYIPEMLAMINYARKNGYKITGKMLPTFCGYINRLHVQQLIDNAPQTKCRVLNNELATLIYYDSELDKGTNKLRTNYMFRLSDGSVVLYRLPGKRFIKDMNKQFVITCDNIKQTFYNHRWIKQLYQGKIELV